MQLLLATTKSAAQALAAKALLYAKNEQDATGSAWSPVFTDGVSFGITYDGSVRGAFSDAELGRVVTGEGIGATETLGNVIEGELMQTVDGVTTGEWEQVVDDDVPTSEKAFP